MRAVSFTTLIQSSPTSTSQASPPPAPPSRKHHHHRGNHARRSSSRYPGQRRPNLLKSTHSPSKSKPPSSLRPLASPLPSPSPTRSPSSSRRHRRPSDDFSTTDSSPIKFSSSHARLSSSSSAHTHTLSSMTSTPPHGSASNSNSNSGALGGGRDSLVADLFWTFHGENAAKFADVTLISSDNRSFPCCRGILAARSDHFARLLFSATPTPASQPSTNVRIDMPGNVLALIVQYLHTGDIAGEDPHDRDALDRLLDVARAAHSMSHASLFNDCVSHLLDIVNQNPAMLCAVFEAFFGEASVVDGVSLLNPLLQHVRTNPISCLLLPDLGSDFSVHPFHALSIGKVNMNAVTNAYLNAVDDLRPPVATGSGVGECVGILELSGRALETLIAEDKKKVQSERPEQMTVHEEFWFYIVWYWAMHNPNHSSLPSSHDGTDENNIKELSIEAIARRTHATQILDLLDSKRMRAAFLLRVVEPTGLMSLHKLCDGYKAHATQGLGGGHKGNSVATTKVDVANSVNAAAEWTRKRLRFPTRQRGVKS